MKVRPSGDNQAEMSQSLIMDSGDQEERGITIALLKGYG